MKKLVIVGTSYFAEVVWTYFKHAGEYQTVAFAAYVKTPPPAG